MEKDTAILSLDKYHEILDTYSAKENRIKELEKQIRELNVESIGEKLLANKDLFFFRYDDIDGQSKATVNRRYTISGSKTITDRLAEIDKIYKQNEQIAAKNWQSLELITKYTNRINKIPKFIRKLFKIEEI